MAKNENLNWQNVELDTLPKALSKAYDEYKAASRVASAKREAFEELATKFLQQSGEVPADQAPVYSHKFGKLAIAFKPASEVRTVATRKAGFSFKK